MKRLVLSIVLLALCAACGKDATTAPTAPTAPTVPKTYTLAGFIHAARDNAPLGNARVLAPGSEPGSVYSDANGHYFVRGIQAGPTTISVELVGWLTSTATLNIAADTNYDVTLSLAPPNVEYRITGTARHCSATYENSTGGTNQQGVTIPFSYAWSGAKTGDFLYMSCQIDQGNDAGNITVGIYKNGSLYKSAFAAGFPNIATASGSY